MSEGGGAENRTSQGLWVRPKAQLLLISLMSLGLLIVAGTLVLLLSSFDSYLATLRETNQMDTQTSILVTSHLYYYLRLAITLAVSFAVGGLALGVMLSHRIFGPIVPIRAHVLRLIEGDYSSRIHLRTHDQFKDVATDLNTLAERLNQKQSGK